MTLDLLFVYKMVLGRGKYIIETSGTHLNRLDSKLLKKLCGDTWFFRSASNKNSLHKNKHVVNN